MLRQSNVSRHQPDKSLEWFYEEWHGPHVDIMRRSPGVMARVVRYVQNRALHDPTLPEPPAPPGVEGWDAMSQLTFRDVGELIDVYQDESYIANVRDHRLSDPAVLTSLLTEDEVVLDGTVGPDHVKAVLFHQLHADADGFAAHWTGEFGAGLARHPRLVRHVRNRAATTLGDDVFAGSRFEGVTFNQYQCYDELWFASREDLEAWLEDVEQRELYGAMRARYLTEASFSFLCREIVQIGD